MLTFRRRFMLVLVVATTVSAIAACGAAVPPATARARTPDRSEPPVSVLVPSERPGLSDPGPPGGEVTLEFAGDVHFTGRTAGLLNDPSTAFGPIASVLSDADVTVVNLETAVTERGVPQPKTFHFRAPPTAFDAVRAAGIDLVTLANNHALDYGRVGLADTLAAAHAASIPAIGAGTDAASAWAPWIVTVRGTKIAYIGVSDVRELASTWIATRTRSGVAIADDASRTLSTVRAAARVADVVIVFMHWGTEGSSCPDGSQKTLAAKLASAGATIIVGSHVHTLQGSGWLGHTFVAYGMGNFLWWRSSWSDETGVLRVTLHRSGPLTARLIPAVVSHSGQPVVATGTQAASISRRYASLRTCAGLSATPPG